jgi:hypothetical protein
LLQILKLSLNPTNHQPRVSAAGEPGQTYVLEFSPDLRAWTPLVTNTPTQSQFEFIDNKGTNLIQRFYRGKKL